MEGEDDWGLLLLSSGPDLGHGASILVDFDQLLEVCWTACFSFPTSVVHLIRFAVSTAPALSNYIVIYTRLGTLEALETVNEQIRAMKSQIASQKA